MKLKNLILISISLQITSSLACMNLTPISEAKKFIDAAPLGVAAQYECKDLPNEECICFDGIDWNTAVIKNGKRQELDYSKPKYGNEKKVETCLGESACRLILEKKDCSKDGQLAFISAENDRVYCIEFKGYDTKDVTYSYLETDNDKASKYSAKLLKDKKDKDDSDLVVVNLKKDLKAIDLSKIKTVDEFIPILNKIIKALP